MATTDNNNVPQEVKLLIDEYASLARRAMGHEKSLEEIHEKQDTLLAELQQKHPNYVNYALEAAFDVRQPPALQQGKAEATGIVIPGVGLLLGKASVGQAPDVEDVAANADASYSKSKKTGFIGRLFGD